MFTLAGMAVQLRRNTHEVLVGGIDTNGKCVPGKTEQWSHLMVDHQRVALTAASSG